MIISESFVKAKESDKLNMELKSLTEFFNVRGGLTMASDGNPSFGFENQLQFEKLTTNQRIGSSYGLNRAKVAQDMVWTCCSRSNHGLSLAELTQATL